MDRRTVLRRGAVLATFAAGGLAGCSGNGSEENGATPVQTGGETLRTAEGTRSEPVSGTVTNEVSGLVVENRQVTRDSGGEFRVTTDVKNSIRNPDDIVVSLYNYDRTIRVYDGDGRDVTADASTQTGPGGSELESEESATVVFIAEVEPGAEVDSYELFVTCETGDAGPDGKLC